MAILIAVAALFLVSAPAQAQAQGPVQAQAVGCVASGPGSGYCPEPADGPVRIGVTGKVVQLVADGDGTCALTEPGVVYCWGGEQAGYRVSRGPMALVALGSLLLAVGAVLVLISRMSLSRS